MTDYVVTWTMDIFDAKSPREAAEKARKIQLDPSNIANVFTVQNRDGGKPVVIDLMKDE